MTERNLPEGWSPEFLHPSDFEPIQNADDLVFRPIVAPKLPNPEFGPADPLRFMQEFEDAENKLAEVLQVLHEAAEAKIEADNVLESKVNIAYSLGDIVGKNEKEREGAARIRFEPLYKAAEDADKAFRLAQHNHRLAQLAYDHFKLYIRFMEAFNQS